MGKVRRIDFSPDEWLAGTIGLKADQRGCYITVCCLIYSRGGPVQDDDADLSHACKVTVDKWRSIRAALVEKGKLLVTDDGKLTNKRCEIELEKALNRTEKARENGQEGGKKSAISRAKSEALLSNINGLPKADASPKIEANHQPSTINHQPSLSKTPIRKPTKAKPQGSLLTDDKPSRRTEIRDDWECGENEKAIAKKLLDEAKDVEIDISMTFHRFKAWCQRNSITSDNWHADWRMWIVKGIEMERKNRKQHNTPPNGSAPPRYGQPARPAPRPIPVVTGRKEDHFPD